MRKGVTAVLAVAALALAGLLAGGLASRSRQVQTLGVFPAGPIAELRAGQQLCEAPVGLAGEVNAITFNPGTVVADSPAMTLTVRSTKDRQLLGRGRLPAGFDPARPQTVRVGRVGGGQFVALCFRNEGPARVRIFGDQLTGTSICTPSGRDARNPVICRPGGVRPTLTTAVASVDGGPPLGGDPAALLLRDEPRSLLARVPDMTRRASLFRPGFVTPAVWWVLLAGWVLLVPAAIALALSAAARRES